MKWQVTHMQCDACGYEWVAVHPVTAEYLECSLCQHATPAPFIEGTECGPSSNTPTTMRKIHDHKVNGLNEAIQIQALDQPGPGGANHVYGLALVSGKPEVSDEKRETIKTIVIFQNGPISEVGFNGLSNEALIAVVIDRMRGFQFQRKEDGGFDEAKRGIYACKENACALTHLEEALMWLQKRTRDRMARGVEGTMKA